MFGLFRDDGCLPERDEDKVRPEIVRIARSIIHRPEEWEAKDGCVDHKSGLRFHDYHGRFHNPSIELNDEELELMRLAVLQYAANKVDPKPPARPYPEPFVWTCCTFNTCDCPSAAKCSDADNCKIKKKKKRK